MITEVNVQEGVVKQMRDVDAVSDLSGTACFSSENNSEMQQLRFILRKCFYCTCFG